MALTEADVQACLATVVDPNTGRDFVAGKAVKKITVTGADVAIELALGYPARSQHESLKQLVQRAVGALPGAGRVTVSIATKVAGARRAARREAGSRREEHRRGGERQGRRGQVDDRGQPGAGARGGRRVASACSTRTSTVRRSR